MERLYLRREARCQYRRDRHFVVLKRLFYFIDCREHRKNPLHDIGRGHGDGLVLFCCYRVFGISGEVEVGTYQPLFVHTVNNDIIVSDDHPRRGILRCPRFPRPLCCHTRKLVASWYYSDAGIDKYTELNGPAVDRSTVFGSDLHTRTGIRSGKAKCHCQCCNRSDRSFFYFHFFPLC